MAMLSQESKASIDSTLNTAFEVASLLSNIVLNILVFVLVLDSSILLGYVVGVLLAFCYLNQFGKLDKIAKDAQNSRLNLIAWLNRAWDNVVLNNKYSQHIYQTHLQDKFNQAKWANVHCQSVSHIVSNIGMLCLLVPVMAMTAWLFYESITDLTLLAVLVATLPRQVQILQVCYTLINQSVNLSVVRSRLDGLEQALAMSEPDLAQRICADGITIKQSQQVFNPQNLPKIGRLTLTGKNGVGKSSQLLLLKRKLGSTAFYLPAKHELCFNGRIQGSTGQKLIAELDEIAKLDVAVLLLDEWDANLDRINTERLDALIDKLSEHKLVLEVRHFK
ncbi:ATP-binding cassette domain-containing protein [Moraxella cuniculi]|nr:ABC transporter ATP-binding protein [Moraxella cuniculi]